MVGRSALIGGALFGASAFIALLGTELSPLLHVAPPWPKPINWGTLNASRAILAGLAMQVPNSLFNGLFFLMLLVILRLLLRKTWIAFGVFLLLTTITLGSNEHHWALTLIVGLSMAMLWLIGLVKGGLLAFLFGYFLHGVTGVFPLTLDFSKAYAGESIFVIGGVLVFLACALGIALAGRSLLHDDLPG